jgi:hypothetical protein
MDHEAKAAVAKVTAANAVAKVTVANAVANANIGKQLFLEQAAAFYDDMKSAASNAPYGQVIDKAEAFALVQGRELIRSSLEAIVQERITEVEQEQKKTAKRALAEELDAIADTPRSKSSPL